MESSMRQNWRNVMAFLMPMGMEPTYLPTYVTCASPRRLLKCMQVFNPWAWMKMEHLGLGQADSAQKIGHVFVCNLQPSTKIPWTLNWNSMCKYVQYVQMHPGLTLWWPALPGPKPNVGIRSWLNNWNRTLSFSQTFNTFLETLALHL